MIATKLRCVNCGNTCDLDLIYSCPDCGDILDVVYEYERLAGSDVGGSPFPGMWRYFDLLPLADPSNIVSLGEGGTALLRCRRLGAEIGLNNLYIKNETTNPTGSFKDRPACLGVSLAKEAGAGTVVVASSGNGAVAVSAYAARAGMKAIVFVPETAPNGKLTQSAVFGAQLIRVRGAYSESYRAAISVAGKYGLPNLTSTFLNPYLVEADKTVAYEISESLGGIAPDYVVVPIGAGPLLVGCDKGFRELEVLGRGKGRPGMIGVQAAGCAPTVAAYQQGLDQVAEWDQTPQTICGGIADPLRGYSRDGTLTLKIIRETGGVAEAVSDEESIESIKVLARTEGIFAEPSGAVGIGALKQLVAAGEIDPDAVVVCLVTGHGLKDPGAVDILNSLPDAIDADEVESIDVLGGGQVRG